MRVINNERIFCCDVDDTIILWDPKAGTEPPITIVDPYDFSLVEGRPHRANIKLLRDKKERGSFVIVWSQGGPKWAAAVIKALDLIDSVDLIICKPEAYLDDLPVEEWMGPRIYLSPDSNWKREA